MVNKPVNIRSYSSACFSSVPKASIPGATAKPGIATISFWLTPPEIPMTSFSILFARFKGDLTELVRGALAIDRLKPGDRVLVAEACAHHPIGEDIGRVKIPRWLTQYVGGQLEFVTTQGHDFPDDLASFQLMVHCGACVQNRREMLSRMLRARQAGVPVTNYGLTIAYSLGIFERALGPFPAAREVYRAARRPT